MNTPLHQQTGMTIISLLIGLLLSMLCVLSGLTLYKNLVHVSAESKLSTSHDGRVTSTLLSLQKAIQVAGYGIANAGANDIVKEPLTDKQRLLWRYVGKDVDGNTAHICSGIEEAIEIRNGNTFHVVRLLEATAGCTSTSSLTAATWPTAGGELAEWQVYPGEALATYLTSNKFLLNYGAITPGVCSPYGVDGALDSHYILSVHAPNSAELNMLISSAANTYSICLANFYTAAS